MIEGMSDSLELIEVSPSLALTISIPSPAFVSPTQAVAGQIHCRVHSWHSGAGQKLSIIQIHHVMRRRPDEGEVQTGRDAARDGPGGST